MCLCMHVLLCVYVYAYVLIWKQHIKCNFSFEHIILIHRHIKVTAFTKANGRLTQLHTPTTFAVVPAIHLMKYNEQK